MEDLHRRLVVTSRAQDRLRAALPGSGSHPAHGLRLTSFKGIAIAVGFWTVVAVAAALPNVGRLAIGLPPPFELATSRLNVILLLHPCNTESSGA